MEGITPTRVRKATALLHTCRSCNFVAWNQQQEKSDKTMKQKKNYEPNKAYLLHGSWLGVWNQVKLRNDKPVWIKLELTPDLYAHAWEGATGIVRAKELGYLEMKAWHGRAKVEISASQC